MENTENRAKQSENCLEIHPKPAVRIVGCGYEDTVIGKCIKPNSETKTESWLMTKALIVYGTRYGATEMTAEEIANVFRQEGLDVKVVNLKDEKVKGITEYDLVLIGSGIKIKKWTKEPEQFLKNSKKN